MTKFVKNGDGNYVDNGLNVVVEEGTHFNDAAIIPTVQYQVFGLDNVWFWDNEGQNYTFDKSTVSTINVKVITGSETTRTYYIVVDDSGLKLQTLAEPTEEQKAAATKIDSATLPSGADENDVYYTEVTEDTYADDPITTPYEFNKYGKEETGVEVLVTLTPNADLKTSYPGAIITVNGKEYDINYTSFKLYMDKDYRISINWVWGSVVETFRIICNR